MSVQNEITRLENAKIAISTAITSKGVTVPAGTKLDGMASLIDSIKAGSDGEYSTLYISTTTPSGSDGVNGDVWIVKAVTT